MRRLFIFSAAVLFAVALGFVRRGSVPRETFYHAATAIRDEHAPGGHGPSNNAPRALAGHDWGGRDVVSLIAFPDEVAECHQQPGFVVRIVNRTSEPVWFVACDSCLYLAQEARTASGSWRAIEAPPQPICYRSLHRVALGADQYWEFTAARSTGFVPTQVRFRLEQGRLRRDELLADPEWGVRQFAEPGGPALYSNEFDGRVSGALYWFDR